ncbi:MAG: N-6 DNA methylase [Lachnospiraceae bacterium]|nr:N-6 DNA methylase [Lachnospiraceae bacterium]
MDLRGINNYNEYYTNHYFSSIFEENASETISQWRATAKDDESIRTPWSLLRDCGRLFSTVYDRFQRVRSETQVWPMIKDLADSYLASLGYPQATPFITTICENERIPIYLEIHKTNGAPLLWVLLANSVERDADMMSGYFFDGAVIGDESAKIPFLTEMANEELVTKTLFSAIEPPRWLLIIGIRGIALIDRNKWNEKRYLYFDAEEIFSRREESTLQAMAVLLHKESLCPNEGNPLLDKLDDNSHRHASGVSQDLKYALREAIELLGNEVLYDMVNRQERDMMTDPVNAGQLTIECLRYMYRMLFMLFIEARPELGYAPMKSHTYVEGYSLEFLRDIADDAREDVEEIGDGYYMHETLAKLYDLIYNGYPGTEDELKIAIEMESLHDVFVIEPLKAHIFDPEYTQMISTAKLRNRVMLKIIDLMSISRGTGRRGSRGRISYSTLGINQKGAVYEALLSYRGFIAEETLFEVKRAQDRFDELDVGYFIPKRELDNYTEDERVRYDDGKLRKYEKGTFIYRLAGREREKSASYYTPEVLTKCVVKYALKELLEGKTADEILALTICEPAMGSAAFLNEAINQLAEAYIDRKQQETGDSISYEDRYQEIQRVKMYIADRNVYGIDLNPIAVELAEVSLWLNTIYKGGFVPWFGTQLINGNSLIGARRQVYRIEQLATNHSPNRWWENAPTRVEPGSSRMPKKQAITS